MLVMRFHRLSRSQTCIGALWHRMNIRDSFFLNVLPKSIAFAADGHNLLSCLAELLAERHDLHVNRAISRWVTFSVHGVNDLPTRTRGLSLTIEKSQDLKFASRERYCRHPTDRHSERFAIKSQ